MSNGFLNQLFTIKGNSISILVVDVVPKCLEFLLVEIIVQRIIRHLGFVTIGDHILQNAFIKYSLYQLVDTITHVYSHEQGLFQSDRFLKQYPHWIQVPFGDTAGSGKYVAETGDITKAAICSSRAAELYDLEILVQGVNHNGNNTTRFVVVAPNMEFRAEADKISAVLRLSHEVGSLHEVLTIFAMHGLNLEKLESRPVPGRSWEYLFFLEFSGNLLEDEVDAALQELSQTCAYLRVMGNFKRNM